MFDDAVIPLNRSRYRLHSDDPSFRVAWRGGSRYVLSGVVSEDPATELDVELPEGSLEIPLAKKSLPEHAVTALQRALPRDVLLTHQQTPTGVQVEMQELVLPAAKLPRLRVFSTDLLQRVRQLEENRIEFVGASGGDAHLTILVENRRVTLAVTRGASATSTAVRVGASIPHGYRALVDGPVVSVWKDADFYEMVA